MTPPSRSRLLEGTGRPPTPPERLAAGPLAFELADGVIRYATVAGIEVVRRVLGAVRDRDWGTVAGTCVASSFETSNGSFRAEREMRHEQAEIAFRWRCAIEGHGNGTLRVEFDGTAETTFLRNRIGLVVLHPLSCAGLPCRVRGLDGSWREERFPRLVAAEQPVPGLSAMSALRYTLGPGVTVEVSFEGDEFETEDQRNWIDASFKTYSTPLSLPFPVRIEAGTRVRQAVTIRVLDASAPHARPLAARGSLGPPRVVAGGAVPLPRAGLGGASHGEPLDGLAIRRLRVVAPSHVRADLQLSGEAWRGALARAAADARALGCALELAAFAREARALGVLAHAIPDDVPIAHVLVLHPDTKCSPADLLREARSAFDRRAVAIGGGTNADFYQLNQFRPDASLMDCVALSVTPQVHAFDTPSLMETPSAIPATLASARHAFPDLPVIVSPVTLRPRFNPVATSGRPNSSASDAAGLPATVDPRQSSLAGAAWTLAALTGLAVGGAASVTWFETTGWHGLIERPSGPQRPDLFWSVPSGAFPLYHVLADAAECGNGWLEPLTMMDDPGRPTVGGARLRSQGRGLVLVANLTSDPQEIECAALADARSIRRLSSSSAEHAAQATEEFRRSTLAWDGATRLVLDGFEYVRLDLPAGG